jgi:hypothetical protein
MRRLNLNGIGVLGPGLNGWETSRPVLANQTPFDETVRPNPVPRTLSPNERRRSSETVRWALVVAEEACTHAHVEPCQLPSVFASSDGDGVILDKLCTALNSKERLVSPTLFHHSVHNAPAGYWHIGQRCTRPSNSLSCYDDSFCGGLLESAALVTAEEPAVLLVAYDLPPPPPLYAAHPIPEPLAIALVLASDRSAISVAQLDLTLISEPVTEPSRMSNSHFERYRREIPAARGLPLLAAVAAGRPSTVYMEFLDHLHLCVAVTPYR